MLDNGTIHYSNSTSLLCESFSRHEPFRATATLQHNLKLKGWFVRKDAGHGVAAGSRVFLFEKDKVIAMGQGRFSDSFMPDENVLHYELGPHKLSLVVMTPHVMYNQVDCLTLQVMLSSSCSHHVGNGLQHSWT